MSVDMCRMRAEGRLSKDPRKMVLSKGENRGRTICYVNVAVHLPVTGREPVREKFRTYFFRLFGINEIAEQLAKLSVGDKVAFSGEMKFNSFRARDGSDYSMLECELSSLEVLQAPKPTSVGRSMPRDDGWEDDDQDVHDEW